MIKRATFLSLSVALAMPLALAACSKQSIDGWGRRRVHADQPLDAFGRQ